MAPVDIHQHLLDVYGDQRVDVSTVRLWVFQQCQQRQQFTCYVTIIETQLLILSRKLTYKKVPSHKNIANG